MSIENEAKNCKLIETLGNGYLSDRTQQLLSNEYQHDRVKMVFKDFASLSFGQKYPQYWKGPILLTLLANASVIPSTVRMSWVGSQQGVFYPYSVYVFIPSGKYMLL